MNPSGNSISIYDFNTVFGSLLMFRYQLENNLIPPIKHQAKIFTCLDALNDDKQLLESIGQAFTSANFMGTANYSDLRKNVYWLINRESPPEMNVGPRMIFYVNIAKTETIHVNLDGHNRPVLRVGWVTATGVWDWNDLDPALFNIKSEDPDFKLKVYIQSHAVERLIERIDHPLKGMIQFGIYMSLKNPQVTQSANHQFLVEYSFFDKKIGYFVATIIDDCVIFRTFLFIINNGTPEGIILEKLTGLKKLDKKYLTIDKMSTFATSDLVQNPEISKLLVSSNCQSLIELGEMLRDNYYVDASITAEKMLNYLMFVDH